MILRIYKFDWPSHACCIRPKRYETSSSVNIIITQVDHDFFSESEVLVFLLNWLDHCRIRSYVTKNSSLLDGNEAVRHWKERILVFLNDVISLFSLPLCIVSHPARCSLTHITSGFCKGPIATINRKKGLRLKISILSGRVCEKKAIQTNNFLLLRTNGVKSLEVSLLSRITFEDLYDCPPAPSPACSCFV